VRDRRIALFTHSYAPALLAGILQIASHHQPQEALHFEIKHMTKLGR
jgi:hypothetical protein